MSNIIEKDIVVIGAGLTGLTTSFYLQKTNADFLTLEKSNKVGGVIQTENENGYIFETGPNTGVVGQYEVAELFENLGSACELETPGKLVSKRYILKSGKWEAMPMGLGSAISTPLFTFADKLRVLGEPFRSPGKNPDEDLASMVKRRLGKSFLDYAIDPFIAGVYSGDPAALITRYALPKLYRLEQDYGSFIGGSIKKSFKKKTPEELKVTRKVFSVKGGLSKLTDAIYKSVGADKFFLGAQNIKSEYVGGKFEINFTNSNNDNITIKANKLITTTGAFSLNSILSFVDNDSISKITRLKYADVVEVILGFKNWNGMKPDGFGGLVPSVEKRDLLGVLFMSSLFANRTPENGTLFTIFLGGMRKPEMYNKSEDEIKSIVEKEFMSLMKPSAFEPELFKINYHKNAIPQYGIDSGERFDMVDKLENQYKGLIIGGNLKGGIGMADRIKQGKELAVMVCGL